MDKGRLVWAIPGIATSAITLIAPLASWQALWVFTSAEPRIRDVLDDPLARAVTELYLQLASVFVGLLVAVITAVVYLSVVRPLSRELRIVCVACVAVGSLLFFYVFLVGGAASVPLDLYISQGPFQIKTIVEMIPTPKSWLTWVRGGVFILGALLALFSPGGHQG